MTRKFQGSPLRPLLEKEFWLISANRKIFSFPLIAFLVVGFNTTVIMATGPSSLTPQSYRLAMDQISRNSAVFGLTSSDVEKLGPNAITFATIFGQLFIIVVVLSALSVFQSVLECFMAEKRHGTMEVLLAAPIREENIVLSKAIIGILMGLITWLSQFALITGSLEYLSLRYLGRVWIPTKTYMEIMIVPSAGLILLALGLSLIAGLRGSTFLGQIFMLLVLFIPVGMLLVGVLMRMSSYLYFLMFILLGVVGLITSFIAMAVSYVMLNRLSFIRNY